MATVRAKAKHVSGNADLLPIVLARISQSKGCIGAANLLLRQRAYQIRNGTPMQTDCISAQLEFKGFDGHKVIAGFEGGAITSDAGALLLRHVDGAIVLFDRGGGLLR